MSSPAQNPVAYSQQQSTQALERASEAQQKAIDQQRKADRADDKVAAIRRELAVAQSEAEAKRSQAHDAQLQAIKENEVEQAAVRVAQHQALIEQERTGQAVAHATERVTGTLTRASRAELDLTRAGDQQPLKLKVTPQTLVTLNGKRTSVARIAPGTPVRAAYRPGVDLPVATRVEAGVVKR